MPDQSYAQMSPAEIRQLVSTASVSGFPLLLVDRIRRSHPLISNCFLQLSGDCSALAPGVQDDEPRLARFSAWIDVSTGPTFIVLDDISRSHFTFTAVDAWGARVADFSSRTTKGSRLELAVVGPDWRGELRSGICEVRTRNNIVWAMTRVAPLVDGRRRSINEPQQPRPLATPTHSEPATNSFGFLEPGPMSAVEQVTTLAPEIYFFRLAVLAERYRPPVDYARLHEALHRLVVSSARAAEPEWPQAVRAAIGDGLTDGLALIRGAVQDTLDRPTNFWRRAATGDAPAPGTALGRAAHAMSALGAPLAQDFIQLSCDSDEFGRPLFGAEAYKIHFPAGALPPTMAYWELSLSPGASSDIRSSLGSRDCLRPNADGSLDVILQREPPASEFTSNWLQFPLGKIALAIRLHCPTAAALNGAWQMPAVERLRVAATPA